MRPGVKNNNNKNYNILKRGRRVRLLTETMKTGKKVTRNQRRSRKNILTHNPLGEKPAIL